MPAWDWLRSNPALLPVLLSVAMAIIFAITVPKFADMRNVMNIFGQLGFLGFLCIGMTFVMVAGGIDLSSYTVVSAAAVVGATVMIATDSTILGCLLMLLIGIAFGAVNGIAIAYLGMIPFIVTLSTMVLAEGFAIWFTRAQSVYGLPDLFIDTFFGANLLDFASVGRSSFRHPGGRHSGTGSSRRHGFHPVAHDLRPLDLSYRRK